MNFYAIPLVALVVLLSVSVPVRAEAPVTVRLTIGQEVVLIDLLDNSAAKGFAAQLPLTLQFKDYVGEEKIATLPKRLSANGTPTGRETPADFAYFVPWGNLAVYYKGFGSDSQILALGRIRTGKAILSNQREDFTATLERLEP